ncbi:MAG TPA: hypothetical protein VF418_13175 [Sphingomonadaceae bacterium]
MTEGEQPTKANLDRSARALLAFLARNLEERLFDYPFGSSYPKNSCESVSLILTYLLEEKYRLGNVRIIKGTNRRHEHHLWVMAGDLIYDLTAHQFPGREPVIGALADEFLLDEYPDWSVETNRDFVDRDEVIALYRAGVIPF